MRRTHPNRVARAEDDATVVIASVATWLMADGAETMKVRAEAIREQLGAVGIQLSDDQMSQYIERLTQWTQGQITTAQLKRYIQGGSLSQRKPQGGE